MIPISTGCFDPEAAGHVSLHIPEGKESESVARSYIVIPSFEAALKKQETFPSPKVNSNITDKISFMKSAAEKSKTQTILQKRGEGISLNPQIQEDSDDEIEIVKIIKTPAEERPNPFLNSPPIGAGRSIMINEKYIQMNMSVPNIVEDTIMTEHLNRSGTNQNKGAEPGNVLSPNNRQPLNNASYAVDQIPRKIVINEKYLKIGKQDSKVTDRNISINPKYMNIGNSSTSSIENSRNANESGRTIKVNEKYADFVTNLSFLNASSQAIQIPNKESDTQDIEVVNKPNHSGDIETVEIVGQSERVKTKQGGLTTGLGTPERTIRINSKYSNFMAGRTPEECGNIAGNDQEASTSRGISQANENTPRIKINEKYATYMSQSEKKINQMEIQGITINRADQCSPNIASNMEVVTSEQMPIDTRDKNQPVSNGPPNKTAYSASTLTSKLRNTKISDIRAQKAEESQNLPLDLSSSKLPHFKRSSQESMETIETKRPKLDDNMRRKSDTVNSPTSTDPIVTNPFARRHSDNYAEATFIPRKFSQKPQIDNEPLPGLWKFLRSLLHNPKYNPKMVTWEILEDGMFRIHSLQDFYLLWKSLKRTQISYELLTKTLKIYDERKFLHSVSNYRCVYKFGVNCVDWKPHEGEISRAGKRPVPNQATWPQSRFYAEFNQNPIIIEPTTLFTLRPLDKSATQLSEMKFLSDNSRIVKTNNPLGNIAENNKSYTNTEEPNFAAISIKTEADDDEKDIMNQIHVLDQKKMTKKIENKEGMEIDCKLTLPNSKNENAILKFDGGFCLELDRSLFKSFETTVRGDMPVLDYKPRIRTTIVHKDKSKGRKKILSRKKFVKRMKPPVDGPLTASQLMDVVVPKKLNFLKPPASTVLPSSQLADKGPKKFNFILPKPGPDNQFSHPSSSKTEAFPNPVATPTPNTNENKQFILQPMYTLSYQPMPSESDQTNISSPATSLSTVVSLHLSEPSSTTSNTLVQSVQQENTSAVRHKLPLIVTQRPSSYSITRQTSPRKEPAKEDQNIPLPSVGTSNETSCGRGGQKCDQV
eukprot:GFUD01015364.1.p1 GENE.GFUD01015364.1~~GFUD01015364.1.p1  ORF type:complete len:1050 (-),score=269.28 GFUD01015364.1:283-3432(-)